MRKKDYNSMSFRNKAIDKLTNGGGKKIGPSHVTHSYKESYKKDKGGERSRVRTQTNVTDLESGKVFHEKYRSRTGASGKQRERTVTYSLPSEGQGYKSVTKPSGKQREKTLSSKRTERLRNKFSMGKTIK
jgi:hypothetical protein|tara:strand:+ start:172 stop:564 length:393 start_codon:yes stop_codon:yes gene_type:complete